MPRRPSSPAAAAPASGRGRSLGHVLVLCGVVGAVAVVPLAMDPWGYNPFGPLKVFVLAVCSVLVAVGLASDGELLRGLVSRLKASRVAWTAGALWALIVLSTLTSLDPLRSVTGSYPEYSGVLTWLMATVIACGAASLSWQESWSALARGVSVSLVIMGGYGLLQLLGLDPIALNAGAAAGRVTTTLGNPSNAGVYLLLAAPFAIERFRSDVSRGWRAVGGVGATLAALMVVFTGSRGAWLGLVTVAVVWLAIEAARWERSRRRVALVGFVAAMLALAFVVLAIPQLGARVAPASGGTVQWRIVAWQAAGRAALDRPLLGWGPDTFRSIYTSYWPKTIEAYASDGATVSDPHNIVMSAAASLGVVGALGLVALIGSVGVACIGLIRARRGGDVRAVAVCAALAGGLVALMFHYATLDTMPIMAALLGLLAGAGEAPAEDEAPVPGRWASATAVVLAGVLTVVTIAAVGVVVADTLMRDALAAAARGSSWSSVDTRLHTAQALAPWEPSFGWSIGKAAIETLQVRSDPGAYADGQAALGVTRVALPSEAAVAYDSAYLAMHHGIWTHDTALIRGARSTFVALSDTDPNNPTYWSARGLAAASLSELAEAERDMRVAILLAPSNAEYRRALRQLEGMAPLAP